MSLPLAEDVLCEHLEGAELGLLCSSLSGMPPRRKESCLSCSPLNPRQASTHWALNKCSLNKCYKTNDTLWLLGPGPGTQ